MPTASMRPAAARRCSLQSMFALLCFLLLVAVSRPVCVSAAAESQRLDVAAAMTLSYYDLLGVTHTATAKEIKKASADNTADMRPQPGHSILTRCWLVSYPFAGTAPSHFATILTR